MARWSCWKVDSVGAAVCATFTAVGFFAVAQPIITQRLEKAKLLEEIDDDV